MIYRRHFRTASQIYLGGIILAENLKEKIADTFLAMTVRKGFDKITVKDLVQECGISRQAFYYHFQDILDVIEWILQKSAGDLLARSLEAENPKEALRLFIDFAMENREFIYYLLNSRQRSQIENIIFKNFRGYLEKLYSQRALESSMNLRDLNISLDFFTYGIAGVLIGNTGSGQIPPDVLTEQLYRLLSGEMLQLPKP